MDNVSTQEKYDVVEVMAQYGGGFVTVLSQLFQVADDENFLKLQRAFPEIWEDYKNRVIYIKSDGEFKNEDWTNRAIPYWCRRY